ncbi:MAG: DUF167 domain-containing protein [bacterium]|nr:DUF167 domain-containing protein [bacterium]
MRITVRAKPKSKETKVEKLDEKNYIVSVKASPVEGKANAEIKKVLAKYFKTAPSNIFIASGLNSKIKIIDIN